MHEVAALAARVGDALGALEPHTQGVPESVLDAMRLTCALAADPSLAGRLDEQEALTAVQAAQQVAAWAGGVSATAAGALMRTSWANDQAHADSEPQVRPIVGLRGLTHASVVDDIALATGIGVGAAGRLVSFGHDTTRRSELLRHYLTYGEIPLGTAQMIFRACKDLPEEVADEVVQRVLEPRQVGETMPALPVIRRRLDHQVALHDPHASTRSRERALARRDVSTQVHRDGTATFAIVGDAGSVAAVADRVERLAKAVKAAGVDQPQSQLRADLALDLLANGQVPSESPDTPLTDYPAAHVTLVMSFATLVGADDACGYLPGHGYVTAASAREIATRPGSIWRRLVVDEVTGTARTLDTTRYQPTAAMRAHVIARDHDCRGPDCTVPASRADLDHDTPWPVGPTHPGNLSAKHRRHHQHKTSRQWQARRDDDTDLITWQTRAGRTYLSAPHAYLHPDDQPIDTAGWPLTPPDPGDPPF